MSNARELHILLVDDDAGDVMNVQRAFKKANITNPIAVASDGIEALALLRDGWGKLHRRLVLLDINMPRMNGIEFLRELRADPALASISVVVLTTSNEDLDKREAYRFHVAGYLLKPVTFDSFVALMLALNKYWTLVELDDSARP
jgi:CheY-like chemotaxis protein